MQLEAKSGSPRIGIMVPARTVAARIYVDRGQFSKAMEEADAVLGAQPGNPDAILIRDRALIGTNEADKALPELENLVAHFPHMSDARLQLASLYMAQKQFDKAQVQFQAVAQPAPPEKPDIRGFIGLQTVKLATGKGQEALQVMQDLVDKNPTVLPYRYQLANFQAAEAAQEYSSNPGNYKNLLQKAADNYQQILKTTANSAEVWLRLGVMQRQLGLYDRALASFEEAGNSDPKSVEAFLNQAMICDVLKKKKEAYDDYTKVLSIDPDNALALNNLAFMTADSGGNLDQAMTYAEKAKKKAPDNADVADTLGYVYYCKNVNGEALRIFRQLAQDHPQNSTFHFHLAMALAKQGDKQSAKDEASKALQLAPSPDQKDKISSFVNKIG
jgi:tetratricopeptide (TPR) repeat protein